MEVLYSEAIDSLQTISDNTVAVLLEQISLYSDQLEEYDRANSSFVMTCIAFWGVIFGIVITLLARRKDKGGKAISNEKNMQVDKALSMLFLTLPAIMTLCLYVFCIQCRRVAFFRGYLRYLEEEISKRIEVPLLFNDGIVGKFLGEFYTNRFGPVVMIAFIFAIIAAGLVFSYRYSKDISQWAGTSCIQKMVYYFVLRVLPIISIAACALFTYDLLINDRIVEEVYQYCILRAGA